ncbi:GGDEF domain-containing protein [Ciceribacter ferrooxidans]|uniref:GGDEF domain-containing protein n=1 Tax=Ciceribacter ferrooxidans TaxID=2509717 RepID=UPI0013ED482E|nr:GGDEF domain-containing protein [Ciceribacter ferrooxidans]
MEQFLHLPTIMVVYALGTLVVAIISLGIWWHDRSNKASAMLGLASVAGIVGAVLHGLRLVVPFWLSTGLGFPIAFAGIGLFWSAFAVFENRRPNYLMAFAGALLSLAIYPLPLFQDSTVFRAVFAAVIFGTYNGLAAWEVYRGGRREPLPSRALACGINLGHALLWLARIPFALFVAPPVDAQEHYALWFVALSLLSALSNMFGMFSLAMLARDRSERRYRIAAETDALTGLDNRRSFIAKTEAMLARPGGPSAMLLCDLDHFKAVNDTDGHLAGDRVLVAFSELLRRHMPENAVVARFGGEEFACLLPGAGLEQARTVADAFREAVGRQAIPFEGRTLSVTVSIGVAVKGERIAPLDLLLASADTMLYLAKAEGRNCVRAMQLPGALAASAGRGGASDQAGAVAGRTLHSRPA